MKVLEIENQEVLEKLSQFLPLMKNEHLRYFPCMGEEHKNNGDHWISSEYLKEILEQGTGHEGYPDVAHNYNLSPKTASLVNSTDSRINNTISYIGEKLTDFQTTFALKSNALLAIYPPGGFLSWHNNANYPGYNFLFTWSETGDGHFSYWDTEKEEVVKCPDVKGWSAKGGYYSSYVEDPKKLMYHCCYTDCWRMTVAFVLDQSEMSLGLHKDLIEEITSSF